MTDTAKNEPAEIPPPGKPMNPMAVIRNDLLKMEDQFKMALPPNIDPQRFVRVVLTAIQQNSDLLTADRKSLWNSCMKAAADGLLPDGREAALVIYRVKGQPVVQYLPMVTGILKKVRNSGELASITSQIVFEKDKFRYWVDQDGEHLEHLPEMFADRGAGLGAYAIAKTKDGNLYIEVMSDEQIDAVRNVSRAKDFGPWSGPFKDEMKRKTVIRRLAKRLPMSTDLEQVIHRDDELFDFSPKNPKESGLAGELNAGVRDVAIEGDRIEELPDLRNGANGSVPHQNEGSDGEQLGGEFNQDVPPTSSRAAPSGMDEIPVFASKGGRGTKPKRVDMGIPSGREVFDESSGGVNA